MLLPILIMIDTGLTENFEKAIPIPEDWEIKDARISNIGALAESGSDYVKFEVLGNDKATAIYEHSTQTGQQGTIADKVPVKLLDKKKPKLKKFQEKDADGNATDQVLIVKATKTGVTGIATKSCLTLYIQKARFIQN